MDTKKVDLLNIGLLLLSLVFAIYFPLRLFLYAYALLGPLHYLTEVNWLEKKQYFVKERKWVWIAVILVLLIVIPKYLLLPNVASYVENKAVLNFISIVKEWSNGFIFLAITFSIGFLYIRNRVQQVIFFMFSLLLALFLNFVPFYILLIGLLLPTVIHVYFFTLIFMINGVLRNKSAVGYLLVLLMLITPLMIALVDFDQASYSFPEDLKNVFTANNFHITNTKFAQFLGLSDGSVFFFYEKAELKILIFMAFAYTYHYLNWFSKTTVIGWHKGLTQKRTSLILFIWLLLIVLFIYDYRIGFMTSLLLSLLHVLLEFPLNIVSLQSLGKSIIGFFQKMLFR